MIAIQKLFPIFVLLVLLIISYFGHSTMAQCIQQGNVCKTETTIGICCPQLYCLQPSGWTYSICVGR